MQFYLPFFAFCFFFFHLVFSFDPTLVKELNVANGRFPTDHWAIELEEGTDPNEIAARHGHEYIGTVGKLKGIHVFQKKKETILGLTHPHHDESSEIKWFEQQHARQWNKRGAPSHQDPLFNAQWHLHTTTNEPTVNVLGAWEAGITGEGVTVAIVDDGIEYTHPDLAPNYRANSSYDFNYEDPDPFPDSTRDDHGTSAGGVAAARDNSVCGVGSAYRAGLAGIRLISKASTDVQEARSLSYMTDLNHIYSNSWGPIDDGKRKEGPGKLASQAIENSIQTGRNGLGSIYVWAGGNGRRSRDNCNYDGWANSRYTISIAAVDYAGEQAWYSESCSMLVVSAPSSGFGSKSIVTTDLMGGRGTSRDDCTGTFGGTSAAAPLAAGVIALILEANPKLSWRDVQGVLIRSAAKHHDNDPSWITNGAGFRYSHNFGFGLIDASKAVEVSKTWKHYPSEEYHYSQKQDLSIPITGINWISTTIHVNDSFVIEHVDVLFKCTYVRRGDLTITLKSPSGSIAKLAEEHGDTSPNYDWRFGSLVSWGEESSGDWILSVLDPRNVGGMITGFQLDLYGRKEEQHP